MTYDKPKEPNRSRLEDSNQIQMKLTEQFELLSSQQMGEIINQLLVIKQEKEGME